MWLMINTNNWQIPVWSQKISMTCLETLNCTYLEYSIKWIIKPKIGLLSHFEEHLIRILVLENVCTNTYLEVKKFRFFGKIEFLCVQCGICMKLILEKLFTNTYLEGKKIKFFRKVKFWYVQWGICMILLAKIRYWTCIVSNPV